MVHTHIPVSATRAKEARGSTGCGSGTSVNSQQRWLQCCHWTQALLAKAKHGGDPDVRELVYKTANSCWVGSLCLFQRVRPRSTSSLRAPAGEGRRQRGSRASGRASQSPEAGSNGWSAHEHLPYLQGPTLPRSHAFPRIVTEDDGRVKMRWHFRSQVG